MSRSTLRLDIMIALVAVALWRCSHSGVRRTGDSGRARYEDQTVSSEAALRFPTSSVSAAMAVATKRLPTHC